MRISPPIDEESSEMGAWNEDIVLSGDPPHNRYFQKSIVDWRRSLRWESPFYWYRCEWNLTRGDARSLRRIQKYYYLLRREGSVGKLKVARNGSG